jgi:hypothetical protein
VTGIDADGPIPGYWPSPWPGECGGPRRQKLSAAPGLDLRPDEQLVSTVRHTGTGRWPVMFVRRDEGELFLQGSHHGSPADGWLERVDPVALEPVAASPMLPSGGHSWCGGVAVHANGDLYMVNGRYVHRLDPGCRVIAARELPLDAPHNGLLVMPDGNIVTKNLQREDDLPCTLSVLEPDRLELVSQLVLPVPSMGRLCANRGNAGDVIYVASGRHVHRLHYTGGRLTVDKPWRADYSVKGADQSPAWDPCLGSGNLWLQDMGRPPGWRSLAATAPLRVYRFPLQGPNHREVLVPFGETSAFSPGPALFDPDRGVLVAYDFANGRTGAWRWTEDRGLDHIWTRSIRSGNQPFAYRDTRELVTEDAAAPPAARPDGAPANGDVVILDLDTGHEKGRATLGAPAGYGMFFCPGLHRDLYAVSLLGPVTRVAVASGPTS